MPTLEGKIIVTVLFVAIHGIAAWKQWYRTRPVIDTVTHFLGGIMLGAWIKDWAAAITLILGWEVLEMLLVNKRWHAFRETRLNKVRDILFGLLGYLIAWGTI